MASKSCCELDEDYHNDDFVSPVRHRTIQLSANDISLDNAQEKCNNSTEDRHRSSESLIDTLLVPSIEYSVGDDKKDVATTTTKKERPLRSPNRAGRPKSHTAVTSIGSSSMTASTTSSLGESRSDHLSSYATPPGVEAAQLVQVNGKLVCVSPRQKSKPSLSLRMVSPLKSPKKETLGVGGGVIPSVSIRNIISGSSNSDKGESKTDKAPLSPCRKPDIDNVDDSVADTQQKSKAKKNKKKKTVNHDAENFAENVEGVNSSKGENNDDSPGGVLDTPSAKNRKKLEGVFKKWWSKSNYGMSMNGMLLCDSEDDDTLDVDPSLGIQRTGSFTATPENSERSINRTTNDPASSSPSDPLSKKSSHHSQGKKKKKKVSSKAKSSKPRSNRDADQQEASERNDDDESFSPHTPRGRQLLSSKHQMDISGYDDGISNSSSHLKGPNSSSRHSRRARSPSRRTLNGSARGVRSLSCTPTLLGRGTSRGSTTLDTQSEHKSNKHNSHHHCSLESNTPENLARSRRRLVDRRNVRRVGRRGSHNNNQDNNSERGERNLDSNSERAERNFQQRNLDRNSERDERNFPQSDEEEDMIILPDSPKRRSAKIPDSPRRQNATSVCEETVMTDTKSLASCTKALGTSRRSPKSTKLRIKNKQQYEEETKIDPDEGNHDNRVLEKCEGNDGDDDFVRKPVARSVSDCYKSLGITKDQILGLRAMGLDIQAR